MAWRDSRSHRRRLALYLSSIVLGVAVLVAIRSLGDNLESTVSTQAKSLLGADLVIRGNRAFDSATESLIDSIGGEQAREVQFNSMVYFPHNGGTRLVQVRAISGGFPFYGELVTEPAGARLTYQDGGEALLDDGLLLQFGASVGDSIKLGTQTFLIGGRLKQIPGENFAAMTLAPRIFIPLSLLEQTGLVQPGSRVSYQAYFRLEASTDVGSLSSAIRPRLEKGGLRTETVSNRRWRMGRTLGNLYNYLGLVGFVALLLGCVGVASAIHVYVRHKLSTVAVLRCLGARSSQAFTIYIIQAAALGLGGSILGAAVGLFVQMLLPGVLAGVLPIDIPIAFSWLAVLQGICIGLSLTVLFALLPLLPLRRISPLVALRAAFGSASDKRDLLQLFISLIILIATGVLSIIQTGRIWVGVGFTLGLAIAFLLLAAVAFLLMYLARRFFPSSWKYVWRQGLANLYRPNNQTRILLLSLGLGTFLISTLYLSHHTLLKQMSVAGGGTRSNMVLFDIQKDQVENISNLVESYDMPVMHRVPVVTMRLSAVKGRSVQEIITDPKNKIGRWVLQREYRTTYRDYLFDTEEITAGSFEGTTAQGLEPVPISPAEDVARRLGVTLGDTLSFDVQGISVDAVVSSLRKVDWQRVQPNFWIVFPTGILEAAPQFYVLTTRVPSAKMSAELQKALVQQFPNVSVVDLGRILQTVDDILSQISFVIRFMALFSVLTGLTVLAAAAFTGRYQRIQEGVLLRTLGATRGQIVQILLLEYLFLGALSALTGLLLAVSGTWALSKLVFDLAFSLPTSSLAIIFALVTLLTVVVGMLNSRGIANRPPLEVLRAEL